MRLITRKSRAWQIAKLCLLIAVPLWLLSVSLDEWEGKRSICLINNLFNVECYGCGISKAIIASIQLDFLRAFHYNRLIVLVLPLLLYLWIRELVRCI